MRIDHVQLAIPAGSEDAQRPFWAALGFAEQEKPVALRARGGLWFRAGPCAVHLGVADDFRPAQKAHPAFSVPDPDTIAETLSRQGAPVVWDDAIPGRRRFFTADPAGNRIEIVADAT